MIKQTPVNILSTHMLTIGSCEDFEDAHARMRDLETGLAQILGFHAGLLSAGYAR
jgi:hypothetical protein